MRCVVRNLSALLLLLFIAVMILNMTGCSKTQKIPEEVLNDPSYQALARIRADVLDVQTIPSKEIIESAPDLAEVLADNEEYVTKITVGFQTEDAADATLADFSGISFCKRNGKPISGTARDFYWHSDNGYCAIEILFVSGKIKASDICYIIQNTTGDITFQSALKDSLSSFDDYEKAWMQENKQPAVWKLGGSHYLNVERYDAEPEVREEGSGIVLCNTRRYVLIPLEAWNGQAPASDYLRVNAQTNAHLPENICVTAAFAEDETENQGQWGQISLNMTAETYIEREVYQSEHFAEDIIRRVNREVLKASILTIEDSQGNTFKLSY